LVPVVGFGFRCAYSGRSVYLPWPIFNSGSCSRIAPGNGLLPQGPQKYKKLLKY
jgi:hypothetical protein